jgi:hypothetical protein
MAEVAAAMVGLWVVAMQQLRLYHSGVGPAIQHRLSRLHPCLLLQQPRDL